MKNLTSRREESNSFLSFNNRRLCPNNLWPKFYAHLRDWILNYERISLSRASEWLQYLFNTDTQGSWHYVKAVVLLDTTKISTGRYIRYICMNADIWGEIKLLNFEVVSVAHFRDWINMILTSLTFKDLNKNSSCSNRYVSSE